MSKRLVKCYMKENHQEQRPTSVLLKAQALAVAVDKKDDNVQSVGAILRTKQKS